MSLWCLQFPPKNKQKTSLTVVKLNSFVRFLEEMLAWINHFDFFWPLEVYKVKKGNIKGKHWCIHVCLSCIYLRQLIATCEDKKKFEAQGHLCKNLLYCAPRLHKVSELICYTKIRESPLRILAYVRVSGGIFVSWNISECEDKKKGSRPPLQKFTAHQGYIRSLSWFVILKYDAIP